MALSKDKKKPLSYKHREYTKNLVKAKGNQTEAYLRTYPDCDPKNAPALASRLVTAKPEILTQARRSLEKNGVSLDVLSKKLKEKLESQKVIVVDNNVQHVNDNSAQLKAVELAYKVHGALKDTDNSVNINVQHNQAIILDKLGARLDAVLRMFEPLKQEALSDTTIYRKVGDNVATNPQVIDNLSTDKIDNSQIIDAECKVDESQTESTSGGTAPA